MNNKVILMFCNCVEGS